MIITKHAVERFRQRHAPHLTDREAHDALALLVPSAERLPEKSILGQAQYLIRDPGVVLIVKNDPAHGLVAVTAITEKMLGPTDDELREFSAAYERAQSSRGCRYASPAATVFGGERAEADKRRDEEHVSRRAAKKKAGLERHAATLARQAEEKAARKVTKKVETAKRVEGNAELERIRRHAGMTENDLNLAKHALRLAMRALSVYVDRDPVATEAWDSIEELGRGYTSERFVMYEKDGATLPTAAAPTQASSSPPSESGSPHP